QRGVRGFSPGVSTDESVSGKRRVGVVVPLRDAQLYWNWPQRVVYGVQLRAYYDPAAKRHVSGRIASPTPGAEMSDATPLRVDVPSRWRRVDRVDYVGLYEGVNWEGDGQHRRWHCFYCHGRPIHHQRPSVVHPFSCPWDAAWTPDQTEPMQVAARIMDDEDLVFFTPAASELQLSRPGASVELCKPSEVPTN
ncbi:MAG: hypothetical protein AAF961_19170, partial [Planctomycetota bacterium]